MAHRRCPGCRSGRRTGRLEAAPGPALADAMAAARAAHHIDRAADAYRAARDDGDAAGMAKARQELVAAEMAYHVTHDRERAEALADYEIASRDGTLF